MNHPYLRFWLLGVLLALVASWFVHGWQRVDAQDRVVPKHLGDICRDV